MKDKMITCEYCTHWRRSGIYASKGTCLHLNLSISDSKTLGSNIRDSKYKIPYYSISTRSDFGCSEGIGKNKRGEE